MQAVINIAATAALLVVIVTAGVLLLRDYTEGSIRLKAWLVALGETLVVLSAIGMAAIVLSIVTGLGL